MEENAITVINSENTNIDYISYSDNEQEEINSLLDKIEIAEHNIKLGVLKIGEYLTQLKAIVKKHGEWEKWLEENVSFSKETAIRYMGLYKEFGVNPSTLTDFKGFGKSQLYILKTLNENERESFVKARYYIKGSNEKKAIENRTSEMSTRELEYIVKKYKKIKQEILEKIMSDIEANFEGRYSKIPTQDEQLKMCEKLYKEYMTEKLREEKTENLVKELGLGISQKTQEGMQEKSIEETVEEMWLSIIGNTIEKTQDELFEEANKKTHKINSKKIVDEVIKLFPDKSEDDIIKEIIKALDYYRNSSVDNELLDPTDEIPVDQIQ